MPETPSTGIESILRRSPIIPVLTIERAEDAVLLARALAAGGLPVLEITLRTPAAFAAIEAIARALPEAVPGVGTVTDPTEFDRARDAGAQFAVSPGFDADLARAAAAAALPYLPGIATASELMAARRLGLRSLKFFPAEPAGGCAALKSLAGPFPEVRFCPTGGIGESNLAAYLALPNVPCVGGSWLAGKADIAAGAWDAITERARRAVALAGRR